MKNSWRWIGIGLGSLVVIVPIVIGALVWFADNKLNRTYAVPVEAISVANDAGTIARGQHIVITVCVTCHGEDLAGGPVLNAPGFAVISAPNLTSGQGGMAGAEYKADTDWVRAIRHGVDPEGKSLLLMPSEHFYALSDADLGAVIAYVKSVPPVDKENADPSFSVIAKVLFAIGQFLKPEAELIDQNAARPAAPPPGVTAAYGEYLVTTHVCQNCHGADSGGGKNPDPNGPYVPNITRGGETSQWQAADFSKALRLGVKPNGVSLKTSMPWKVYGRLTDDEISAVWLYLQSIPVVNRKP